MLCSNRYILAIIFAAAIYFSACKEERIDPTIQAYQQNYFPLKTGSWIEYEADSIVHYENDDPNNVDTSIGTFHFYLREEVDTPFSDGEGKTAYVIRRYKRENDTLPWSFINVWTAKLEPLSAQRVEDNIRFLRMEFPINSSTSWNGNAYNFLGDEIYSYENIYEPMQFGPLHFDSTVTVLQNDFLSYINRIFKQEVYGANVGLLYKEIDSVNTKNTVNGQIILNGLEYKLSITNYSH